MRVSLLLLLLLLVGCVQTIDVAGDPQSFSYDPWATVLQQVDEKGRVDYQAIPRDSINEFVAMVGKQSYNNQRSYGWPL